MKLEMFISFILALLLLPLANSCDPKACKVGTSAGSAACQVGAGVGGAVATAACAAGAAFTFGLSCLGAVATIAAVGTGCKAVGEAVGNACDYCASGDAPDFQEIVNKMDGFEQNFYEISDKLDGSEQNFQEIFKKLDGTDHKFKEIFNKLDGTEQNLQEITNKLNGFELNFEEFVDKTDLNFKKIANKLDGIEQTQLKNHLKQEAWFQQLVENDKNIILGQVENFKKTANKLDGIEQTQLENHLKQEAWFQQLVENDKNIILRQVENLKKIANKLDGIKQTQLENHLQQEVWFQQLVENDKNIILRQGEMIVLQQTSVGKLDQLISTTEILGHKIEHSQMVTLYGQDITRVRNVRSKFKRMTRGTSGVIINDRRSKVFRDAVLSPVFGSESSINNIFLMLIGGHILKKESINETPEGKYCKPEVHQYFIDVLVEALMMHATALAMDGYTLSPGLTKYFNEDIVKATSAYNRHCDCLPGLKKANRGNVSTLLDRLPSSSQNLYYNRGQVARMENSVMRIKMDLIFNVKNFEPNEIAENVLENHSVEDIELVVASVMNKKEGDLELQDYADICVDKERNKVKTCAAFTQDSFVTSCVPPQTLEHRRFFCLEDGVTCHVTCDKGYYLETTTDRTHMFMECLDNTWTPLPTTLKCVPAVDGGWSNWGEYGECSKDCGGGTHTRTRTCTNPVPQHGGSTCEQQNIGDDTETEDCNIGLCVPCRGGATHLSTSPRRDMVLCKDKTKSTCEKDFESFCPAGWNLCTPNSSTTGTTAGTTTLGMPTQAILLESSTVVELVAMLVSIAYAAAILC